MFPRTTRVLSALVLSSSFGSVAMAEENLWIYAKGTDTRPAGSFEFKLYDTIRLDKNSGDYTFHDIRPEVEYGVTDSITVSAEAILFSHDYEVDDPELNPMYETQEDAGGHFKKSQYAGYELGLKYNILSPYISAVGLSLGLGYEHRDKYRLDGADIDQDSFLGTIFLQKDFLDDTIVTALTIKTEFERRTSPGVLEEEISFEVAAGISYRVAPKWYIGLEYRQQSDYLNPQEFEEAGSPGYDSQGFNLELEASSFDWGDFNVGSRHQYGAYFGPTVHYAEQSWWVTAGALWQIKGGGSQFSYKSHGRNWDEHEKLHIGLFFGYEM